MHHRSTVRLNACASTALRSSTVPDSNHVKVSRGMTHGSLNKMKTVRARPALWINAQIQPATTYVAGEQAPSFDRHRPEARKLLSFLWPDLGTLARGQ